MLFQDKNLFMSTEIRQLAAAAAVNICGVPVQNCS